MNAVESAGNSVPLVEVQNLTKRFTIRQSWTRRVVVTAVDGISFRVEPGRTMALVGESGCGKTTVGKLLLGLMKQDEGVISFRGRPLAEWTSHAPAEYRRAFQMVFQNPLASFDPMLNINSSLLDSMRLRGDLDRNSRQKEAIRLLARVGLEEDFAKRYPSEMSGGQLQRVGVARALAPDPRVVFLDEPTSALDMSIQGQIINLLLDLQMEYGFAYVLVSHDLRVIRAMAHTVLVMYLGQVVEEGSVTDVLTHPLHPYTQGLLAATLVGRSNQFEQKPKVRVRGEVLQLPADYKGCKLTRRCPFELDRCRREPQQLAEVLPGHHVRCWRAPHVQEKRKDSP
jgi:oligopeptide/dipeptide ABC transporter ATP-binding protein